MSSKQSGCLSMIPAFISRGFPSRFPASSEAAPSSVWTSSGTRVAVYRGSAGKPVVQSAWCPHLGADLSIGEIVDGQIRCAYHHWRFDDAGICAHIPTGDKIPPGARIFTYPTAEA